MMRKILTLATSLDTTIQRILSQTSSASLSAWHMGAALDAEFHFILSFPYQIVGLTSQIVGPLHVALYVTAFHLKTPSRHQNSLFLFHLFSQWGLENLAGYGFSHGTMD